MVLTLYDTYVRNEKYAPILEQMKMAAFSNMRMENCLKNWRSSCMVRCFITASAGWRSSLPVPMPISCNMDWGWKNGISTALRLWIWVMYFMLYWRILQINCPQKGIPGLFPKGGRGTAGKGMSGELCGCVWRDCALQQ